MLHDAGRPRGPSRAAVVSVLRLGRDADSSVVGSGFARDRTSIVRTSMTAGILSRVTADLIQFDAMTTGDSSRSPVFNTDGEVISVHRAGGWRLASSSRNRPSRSRCSASTPGAQWRSVLLSRQLTGAR